MWRVGVVAGGHPVREAPEPKISPTRQSISATHRKRDRGFRLMGGREPGESGCGGRVTSS